MKFELEAYVKNLSDRIDRGEAFKTGDHGKLIECLYIAATIQFIPIDLVSLIDLAWPGRKTKRLSSEPARAAEIESEHPPDPNNSQPSSLTVNELAKIMSGEKAPPRNLTERLRRGRKKPEYVQHVRALRMQNSTWRERYDQKSAALDVARRKAKRSSLRNTRKVIIKALKQ